MRSFILGFLGGVGYLQTQGELPSFSLVGILLLAAALAGLLVWRLDYRLVKISGLAGCGALLGFCWAALFAHYYLQQELPVKWEGRDVTVIGTVESLPTYFEQGVRFNFAVEKVLPQNGEVPPIPSLLALSWYRGFSRPGAPQLDSETPIGHIEPGARWQLSVRLKRPHGNANPHGFDYEVWLLEQNLRATGYVRADKISSIITANGGADFLPESLPNNRRLNRFVFTIGHSIEAVRSWVRQRMLSALPEKKYVGVLIALVIGDQRAVDQSDWQIFNRTGVGHLISISGLHITMIAGLFAAIMSALWRRSFFIGSALPLRLPAQKAAVLAGAITALLYVLLAGFGLPAQRTLYMLLMVALALWTGRLASVSHVLCMALMAVLVRDPWAVLSPGFWLSFGAVGTILYASVGRTKSLIDPDALMPIPTTWTKAWFEALKAGAHTQYVVTIGLVPLTILLFGQISLVSPLANAIAIPLIGLIVTPLALIGSMLPAPLSTGVLLVAHTLVEWLASILGWLSSFPLAVWQAPLPPLWAFVIAMIATLWLLAPRGWPLRWLALIGWLPLILNSPTQPAEGEMTVTAFDVGQGMALLIETSRHRLLYDTGPYNSPESDAGSRIIVPYLKARGITSIDTMVISHSDSDHSGGALSVMKAVEVGHVVSSLRSSHRIVAAALKHTRCENGQSWNWDGAQFEMLFPTAANYKDSQRKDRKPPKANNMSCTLKITNGDYSILLPGDIEKAQERQLVLSNGANAADLIDGARSLKSTVLLAPHHGSGTSSTSEFLEEVDPSVAIFQVGYRNRFHHPQAQVWERYVQRNVQNLRNDHSGAILLHFGGTLVATEYRQQHKRYWYGR
ncbi:DNA internalization-related competence protein ComEC/Rec2 [Glaciimonas immobilis]|uniref:Competence protein ComEC n=1 Tax=Glaciimonas immobilis TaxID=728004 RepID=A0A840RUJ2_9BURK|nr:DNA internalization-related competence protein ComEC/Rec2 [Glaciimonas immobilis]KAF3996774.1 DNA internalization-related competence protein ComEC/Rec2 [Glaciimonas immobilis]MBB5201293.1 competence protein ComEC [Glaciimonas immobilis]